MTKVLIVEDSAVVRDFLVHTLSADPAIEVVGTAGDGEEAIDAVKGLKPDVITMDIRMPKINGIQATRKIMETYPTPIVIVSGSLDGVMSFRAMEAGALAVLQKPLGLGHPEHEATARQLVQTLKLMSEVKVVRRWARLQEAIIPAAQLQADAKAVQTSAEIKVIAIGASTGGPIVLRTILAALPDDFPLPVLIVQHIAAGFIQGFAEWLAESTGFPVHIAAHSEHLKPGHACVAPDGFHMGVETGGRIALSRAAPDKGLRPSVSYLFRSVAKVYGPSAVGVLLTGMGKDGAEELKLMREKGAVTIVQDEASSIVHGMPGEAINLDAAAHILAPEKIAAALANLASKR